MSDPLGLVGTVIADKYLIESVIGEGGFSIVYRAEHLIWKQPVAVKAFRALADAPEHARKTLLEGFIQEGKLMTSLSSRSPSIVQARDVGTLTLPDGRWTPYMVLEWLEGLPLDAVLAHEAHARMPPRTVEQAMNLLETAAQALELAHRHKVAHRDVKPANFMIIGDARSADATVKVLDFGIAKVMADHAEHSVALAKTGTEITSFTPNYGAPEQFSRSHGATGPWTDVFAFALVLVEILRGGAPALDGGDFMQLGMASRDPHRRPTPRTLGAPVSDAVERVFQKALAVTPGERFPSMGPFWAALREAQRTGHVPESPMTSPPEWTFQGGPLTGQQGPASVPNPVSVNVMSPVTTPGALAQTAIPDRKSVV